MHHGAYYLRDFNSNTFGQCPYLLNRQASHKQEGTSLLVGGNAILGKLDFDARGKMFFGLLLAIFTDEFSGNIS